MRVTNYILSKRLSEIGFKTEYDYAYFDTRKFWKSYNCPPTKFEYADSQFVPFYRIKEGDPDLELVNVKEHGPDYNPSYGYNDSKPIPSYDLETIVDIFPLKIGGYGYFSIGARKDNPSMPFAVGYNLECDDNYGMLFCDELKDESLADTAARLLILLESKGLITFGDKK